MTPIEKAFVRAIRAELSIYGVKLNLTRSRFVYSDGSKCFGFFDEKQIRVGKGNPRWIEVLAHEYSHFIQWVNGSRLYSLCFGPMANYANVVEDWLHGKDFEMRRVRKAFNTYRAMERECEMIAVDVFRKFNLNVDIERYKQEANCYIYMHHLMEMKRIRMSKFKKDPLIPHYIRKMPSSFRSQSHNTMPKAIQSVLDKCV